jgi:hypothetical protein
MESCSFFQLLLKPRQRSNQLRLLPKMQLVMNANGQDIIKSKTSTGKTHKNAREEHW